MTSLISIKNYYLDVISCTNEVLVIKDKGRTYRACFHKGSSKKYEAHARIHKQQQQSGKYLLNFTQY